MPHDPAPTARVSVKMHAECGLRTVTADQLTEKHPLGEGGFGRVVRAWYRPWGMEVAIKMLHGASQTLDKDARREAELMSSLRFPHVVFLVGLYCHPEEPLGIVMEFLPLGSLASVQERLSLLPALRVRLIHEVALGMNYLHGLDTPLLHLDLNPRNVLLDGELHAKIADFGLSKLKRRSSGDSSCLVAGTLEYLPPECFDPGKDHYKPGPPTDIYSFGIIIWSILTGKQPYGALNNQTLIRMLIPKGQRPDLHDLPAEDELEGLEVLTKLMAECWSNTPEIRPPFKDILVITEKVFQFHRGTILDAVHRLLSNLNSQPTSRTLSSRTADSIGSLRSEDSHWTDPRSQPPTSPQTDTEAREGEQRRGLLPHPPAEGGATACPVREQEERMSAPLIADHGRKPPPTATPGMRQECSEGRQQASAQRKLPEEPGCSAGTFSTGMTGEGVEQGQHYRERGKITMLASRIEGLQIGNRNTMHIIRRSPRK
ncbi:ankyrin repeat and protein kinase domain-containing protein 1-like [Hypanus sabinus]|uniref:ankyrin repeat and protein kinase domain-containing protein 1-like n=1 Tax=Hypanus sabinus TaxID=79690 RepID=UPI0028C4DF1C|nr:ankyrin repeat and protein kinase domain-containing protein 1-like [Hypanus sabinus]